MSAVLNENSVFSETQDRVMLTGRHIVRDVTCKSCQTKLGWIYEYATEENQRYKVAGFFWVIGGLHETEILRDFTYNIVTKVMLIV